ncbi:MAG: hypothetical protein KAH38_13240 [Candidatus Hydrogenedentes bacterium]|nr:hypothetical protein [Candidatus Hydrogenedentota bacterium]
MSDVTKERRTAEWEALNDELQKQRQINTALRIQIEMTTAAFKEIKTALNTIEERNDDN